MAIRSCVRMRVASRDWWASRKVVSVSSRRFWSRSQREKPSGPSSPSSSRVPGSGERGRFSGTRGGAVCSGRSCPFTSGLPFTSTSPM
jgi:hypothetical protein